MILGMRYRCLHQIFLCRFLIGEFSTYFTFTEHDYAVTHSHDGSGSSLDTQNHSFAFGGKFIDEFVNLNLCTYVDTAGRLVKKYYIWFCH